MNGTDPERIHQEAIIINGVSPGGKFEESVMNFLRGGVTATNYTFVMSGNFLEGVNLVSDLLTQLNVLSKTLPVRLARNVDDIRWAKENNGTSIVMGFQSAEPIEKNIRYLDLFFHLGLRILQLTYQRRNLLADGCGEPADAGLSLFGKEVIARCNELGILIDLSHVGYKSTMEAIRESKHPVAFTHCNLYSVNPIPRNKRDDQFKAVAEKGGVVGVGAISRFLAPKGGQTGVSLSQYLDQIDYLVELIGIDHVGIGLDIVEGMTAKDFAARQGTFFATFPELKTGGDFPFENYYVRGLNSSANIRIITQGLAERGYREDQIKKILGGNFLSLFQKVWSCNGQ